MLFTFNDEFIAAVAGGLTDDDVRSLFQEALDAGASEIVDSVARTVKDPSQPYWDDEGLVFDLSASQAGAEFGTDERPTAPAFRQGVVQAAGLAKRAMEKVLNDER